MPKSNWRAPADPEAIKVRITILRADRQRLKKQLDQFLKERYRKQKEHEKRSFPHPSMKYQFCIKNSEYYKRVSEIQELKNEINSWKRILFRRYKIKI